MGGNVIKFLTFSNGERKIAIKDIGALREVSKKEFYPQLVAHLHNGKLESV